MAFLPAAPPRMAVDKSTFSTLKEGPDFLAASLLAALDFFFFFFLGFSSSSSSKAVLCS